MKHCIKDQKGAALVEYVTLMAFISIVAIGGVRSLGTQTEEVYESVEIALQTNIPSATDNPAPSGPPSFADTLVRIPDGNGGWACEVPGNFNWHPSGFWLAEGYYTGSGFPGDVKATWIDPGDTFHVFPTANGHWYGTYSHASPNGITHYWAWTMQFEPTDLARWRTGDCT